ncbi:hypothetical protein ACFQJD_07825 [Haloplanus sp. GCM10025708]
MFVTTVHPDEQERPDLQEEKVLWFDGDEIGRYSMVPEADVVGGEFAYLYIGPEEDEDGINCRYGGEEVGQEYENVSKLGDIDGELAYRVKLPDDRVEGEKDAAIVYQGTETDAYRSIHDVFEVDGSATFLAQTGTKFTSNVLVREE